MKFFTKNKYKNLFTILILINEIAVMVTTIMFILKLIYSSATGDGNGAILNQLNSDTILYNDWIIAAVLILNTITLFVKFWYLYLYNKEIKNYALVFIPVLSVFLLIKVLTNFKLKNESLILKWASYLVLISLPVISLVTLSFSFNKNSNDNPTKTYKAVAFSNDPKKPNVIDIFSDGLDPINLQKTGIMENLKGFHFFPKVVSRGFSTEFGFGAMFHGEGRFNDTGYPIRKRMEKWEQKIVSEKVQKTLVGSIHMWAKNVDVPRNYVGGWSGNGVDLENQINEKDHINVLNWSRAREDMYKKHHTINLSPFSAQYEDFIDDIHINKAVPSYTQINENITHHPIMIDKHGHMRPIFNEFGEGNASYYLIDMLSRLRIKLKSIGVYENTIISIYGDHASHMRMHMPTPSKGDDAHSLKNITALLIKPLGHSKDNNNKDGDQALKIHKDMSVDSAFIRRMTEKNFDHNFNFNNWLTNEQTKRNLKPDRVFKSFTTLPDGKKWVWFNKIVWNKEKEQFESTSAFKNDNPHRTSWYLYNNKERRIIADKIANDEGVGQWAN